MRDWFVIGCCCALAFIQSNATDGSNNPKKIATNLQGFGIPFRIDANDSSLIEIQLYLSEDQGKTWRFHDRQTTDKAEFPFEADDDGEYWFALKTLDRNRRLLPEGDVLPELIVLIDTVKPKFDFQVTADPAGRVNCRWRATDQHLDTESLQILYQPIGSAPDAWSKVPIQLTGTARNGVYADQLGWWPETAARSLTIRMSISDTAGNLVQQDRQVSVPPSPWRHRQSATARVTDAANTPAQPHWAAPQSQLNNSQQAVAASQPATQQPRVNADGMICKDGICRRPPIQKSAIQEPNNQVAAQTGSPRTAKLNSQATRSFSLPLIGDPPVFAAPPMPAGYLPEMAESKIDANQNTKQNSDDIRTAQADGIPIQYLPPMPGSQFSDGSSNSTTWNSRPERWTPQNQAAVSTTLGPHRNIIPNPYAGSPPPDERGLPESNPSSMKTVGDQVVSESTTMGPSNQYRGLKPLGPNKNRSSQHTLLPNQNFPNRNQQSDLQDLGQPEANANAESAGNNSSSYPSTYPQTGYGGFGSETTAGQEMGQGSGLNASFSNTTSNAMNSARRGANNGASNFRDSESWDASDARTLDQQESATQMIGSKRFRLNYGIDAIDPSGVAKVDLWMTRDGGQNWTAWGSDPDNVSPFPVEVKQEGRYGFRIVVHSKDGLTGRGPASGDAPDIWVHIDTQSPLAQITAVPYGRGEEAGRLEIKYSVADDHLVLRPIALAYSSNPKGPWELIAEGVRNEGRYLWKPTSNVPDRIFLRLDARDKAGNTGVHILSQAIDVSGLVPRGTIHGVTPVAR